MKTSKYVFVGLAILSISLLLRSVLDKGNADKPHLSLASEHVVSGTEQKKQAPNAVAADTLEQAQQPRREEPIQYTNANDTSADDYDDSMEDVMRAVLDGDKLLAKYWYYHKTILMNAEEREKYHAFLSDRPMLTKIKSDLISPQEKKSSAKRNLQQLMEVDYLRDALSWDGNSQREALLGTVEELIINDNFDTGLDQEMRRTLATVKMELYNLLLDHDPSRAAKVLEQSRGTRLEDLIAFIADHLHSQRQTKTDVEVKL